MLFLLVGASVAIGLSGPARSKAGGLLGGPDEVSELPPTSPPQAQQTSVEPGLKRTRSATRTTSLRHREHDDGGVVFEGLGPAVGDGVLDGHGGGGGGRMVRLLQRSA